VDVAASANLAAVKQLNNQNVERPMTLCAQSERRLSRYGVDHIAVNVAKANNLLSGKKCP
jgi:hypothetical protein